MDALPAGRAEPERETKVFCLLQSLPEVEDLVVANGGIDARSQQSGFELIHSICAIADQSAWAKIGRVRTAAVLFATAYQTVFLAFVRRHA